MDIIDYKAQYEQDLKDPRWKSLVKRIRYRDNDCCKICGRKKKRGVEMNVHHLHYYPNRKPWEYDESDLITLCRDCHEKEHIRIAFEKLQPGNYFYHKWHNGVGIVESKGSNSIWFDVCWTETKTYEGEDHGRLYVMDIAPKEDIRRATRKEINEFWQKIDSYYGIEFIIQNFGSLLKHLLPEKHPIRVKAQKRYKEAIEAYEKQKRFINEKYHYFLLVSDENFAMFDDNLLLCSPCKWPSMELPYAYFLVAPVNDVMNRPNENNSKKVKFEEFDFSGYRAATTDELYKWLEYEDYIDNMNKEKAGNDLPF